MQDCVNNGKIRPYCVGAEADPLTQTESRALMIAKEAYYREHWHRIIFSMIRYKNPSVANADAYSVSTFEQDKTNPIFFHVEFMKPGKSTYLVEHNPVNKVLDVFMNMNNDC